ncbi:hypothetical protein FISHEDRAFT_40207 [Fistulina hepatica ATCC 64428]|uniref:Helicase C-terminal domain-containing protein n=1 Tax=Fistulina hepatica ATCC 64428 TaxID=1128425 RepID=A0A0D7AF13_9AGAR|nr:hypothetical protein FISHEDRAFT_40207 [Fistulina hepatica ATCC 64428]
MKRPAAKKPRKPSKKKARAVDDDDDDDDVSEGDIKDSQGWGDPTSLPPINDIPAIFTDLVSRIPPIKGVAEHIAGRKLRVATMCSGTESPLLALEMIQHSIEELHGVQLSIEHVFSCEIEPFKQAYIERNFQPPILFRDVCELGNDEAYVPSLHTAYGSLARVPGDVDLLVAGTSCVDYSNLNNRKQDIESKGESGETFRGMMRWVGRHRPPLVVLENICNAPWDKVVNYFADIGYTARQARVDTKNYYIPHTRTRGYLVAVHDGDSSIPDMWHDWVFRKLPRKASSTLDAFLLPSDDPRIHRARQKLVGENYLKEDKKKSHEWSRCESRHARARQEEALGNKRPLTAWEEGTLPDFAWGDWAINQVERVWDLMDISLLRSAKKDADPCYKTVVWNLSQNVDRTIGSNKVGICPCLTPTMIAYITNRGGPLVGIEALSMQGLPVDKLLLTRETEDQLADLAGNAMSTTVVGTCILAALVSGKKLLKSGSDKESYEAKHFHEDEMEVDERMAKLSPVVEVVQHVVEGQLTHHALDLTKTTSTSLSELLCKAAASARRCSCEGRIDMTPNQLFWCADCETSICKKCLRNLEHVPELMDLSANPRLPPAEFAQGLKDTLPMSIHLTSFTGELLDSLYEQTGAKVSSSLWEKWRAAVIRASESEIHFVEVKRQDLWSVAYRSSNAVLELTLHPQQPCWYLFALPETSEPANAEIRYVLESAVGRLLCKNDTLLSGEWEFALPQEAVVDIQVRGSDQLMPSWRNRLGLEEFQNEQVAEVVHVRVPEASRVDFDRDISGDYRLLPRCGTANGALHKRMPGLGDEDLPPLYMLYDPHRTRNDRDCFVFSISKRRYEYGESRPVVAKMVPSWKQPDTAAEKTAKCCLPVKWMKVDSVRLEVGMHFLCATFAVPTQSALDVPASHEACASATTVLVCDIPLSDQAGPEWPRGWWRAVDKISERSVFHSLAWLLERVRHVDGKTESWRFVDLPEDHSNCERCAPSRPRIKWITAARTTVAFEDPVQAGEYERRLKCRPSPFVTQLKLSEDFIGTVRVAINIPTLLHRALSRLPSERRIEQPVLSWRMDTNYTPAAFNNLPRFVIKSNKTDPEHAQPPNFKLKLRKEQLRSLDWMLRQESVDTPSFVEEEIAEAILAPLGWRAEGRAQRSVKIRGGVLADAVGYGKTAITLGVIDYTAREIERSVMRRSTLPGKIVVHATLVIVPGHLCKQWEGEVRKFTGNKYRVVTIFTMSQLNSVTIEDIEEADIVIVAVTILRSIKYHENLTALAGCAGFPTTRRQFDAHLERVLAGMKARVDQLRDEGSAAALKSMRDDYGRARKEAEDTKAQYKTSKRLKGKSYQDSKAAKTDSAAPKKTTPKSRKRSDESDADEVENNPTAGRRNMIAKPTPDGRIPEVPSKAPKRSIDTDPWSLRSGAAQRDWKQMKAPPLEMFQWSRKVIDEYTYLQGDILSLATNLTADRHWVLSGTPPVHDFGAVKTIAVLLDIHLGVDDDAEGTKRANRDLTNAEKFHSFREVRSLEWHAHRHQVGQMFLDHFVRQNVAEIDEIPWKEHFKNVVLPAPERAIYLEMMHHLEAVQMTNKKAKKTESDREKRLNEILLESNSAEEALLKRCSHFDLHKDWVGDARSACDIIVEQRNEQLQKCKESLRSLIKGRVEVEKKLAPRVTSESLFNEFVRLSRSDGLDDKEATDIVLEMLKATGATSRTYSAHNADKVSEKLKEEIWDHREKTHEVRRVVKELIGRIRSARFFGVVRDLQKHRQFPVSISCPSCGKNSVPIVEAALLSSCGHTGCYSCVRECAEREECVYTAQGECQCAARVANIIKAEVLGIDEPRRKGVTQLFGRKLEMVVDLLKKERVLVFVQFPDLTTKVAKALDHHGIGYMEIQGSAHKKSVALEKFQQNSSQRVLLLNVMDESASGANLTGANHVIFLSPLLTPTQQIYDANETQAIGRVVRYGQTKLVHIWRFLTDDTIDMSIYKERRPDVDPHERAAMDVD